MWGEGEVLEGGEHDKRKAFHKAFRNYQLSIIHYQYLPIAPYIFNEVWGEGEVLEGGEHDKRKAFHKAFRNYQLSIIHYPLVIISCSVK